MQRINTSCEWERPLFHFLKNTRRFRQNSPTRSTDRVLLRQRDHFADAGWRKKSSKSMIYDWNLAQEQLGSLVFWGRYSWRMACGTDGQFEATLKENICHFLIEGFRGSCPRCDLSQLDLGNWLCWECWEDRWGQEEQVVLVGTCEVLSVPLIWPSPLTIAHHVAAHAGMSDSGK